MSWVRYLVAALLLTAALYCLGRDFARLHGSANAAIERGEEWREEFGLGWFFAGQMLLVIAGVVTGG